MNISHINIELTNQCNKKCWICHKTKVNDKSPIEHIDFNILKRLSKELPDGIIIYFHYYGEPLLYPKLGDAIGLFKNRITSIVTNGKLILKKYNEIVDNLDTLCISVFEKDPDQEEQFQLISEFLEMKNEKKPLTIIKLIGNIDYKAYTRFKKYALITTRTLFEKRIQKFKTLPLMPEYGICSDFLLKPLVNRNGDVSICCCFDPKKLGVIGNLNNNSLEEIWNCEERKEWLQHHMSGNRSRVPLCKECNFWGIPS